MGTSTSQRSPSTPNWGAAQAAYKSETIPVSRAVQEVWRAATNQPNGNLAEDLSASIVSDCLSIAVGAASREEAVASSKQRIAASGAASLAAEIAQRAVALSFREGGDRATAFASSLFSEAANYLVSRDISGFVGEQWRFRNVSEAVDFKRQVRATVENSVASVRMPVELAALVRGWGSYVTAVVDRLKTAAKPSPE